MSFLLKISLEVLALSVIFWFWFAALVPEWVGVWQANAENAFILQAEKLGMWE